MDEAPLADVGSGLAPAGEGWFVVSVRDAAWLVNDAFGARCRFKADVPVVRGTAYAAYPHWERGPRPPGPWDG